MICHSDPPVGGEESNTNRSFGIPQDDDLFSKIISVENLLLAWQEFVRGKRMKPDVQEFSLHLMDNILALHAELKQQTYQHGGYHHFRISDPKPRDIHKASVRDRLVHHAIYRILYPFFDRTFIADSYSCRNNKGSHKALNRFRSFSYQVSKNNTRTCWVLKGDIKKFFANISHSILLEILKRKIPDQNILWLLENIIESFTVVTASTRSSPGNPWIAAASTPRNDRPIGLPLGNLTSQLLVNIYMNEFDQWVKHKLKTKYYLRYADDFVVFSTDRAWLERLIQQMEDFLCKRLCLTLHPQKLFIKTVASGVDFLGWIHFPDHRVLRRATRRRTVRRLAESPTPEAMESYRGLLRHGNTYQIKQELFGDGWG